MIQFVKKNLLFLTPEMTSTIMKKVVRGEKMSAKKILLINPNQLKPVVCPIALDYLTLSLKEKGYAVDVLDLAFSSNFKTLVNDYFEKNSCQAIGVTIRNVDDSFWISQDFFLPRIKEITDYIKSRTDAPIILGGSGFSVMPERILKFFELDLGIYGEGEDSFPSFLEVIREERRYSSIPGLVYKTQGGFRRNPTKNVDLSRTLRLTRDAIDNERYFQEGGMGAIETKRGCSKTCIYCLDPLCKGRKVRLRQSRGVVDEIEIMFGKGINYFHFCDSEFNLPYHHAKAICEEIIKRGLAGRIFWYTYASPTPFTPELASLMKTSGCEGVDFGVDSGSNEMLKRLDRDFTSHDLVRTAKICHQHGLTFMYDLLLGGPGETNYTLKETVGLMKKIKPSRVGVATGIRIYPGTRLSEMVLREGSLENNKNLYGKIKENADFFEPIFYVSSLVGEKILPFVATLVGGDERFFLPTTQEVDDNYNYNDNSILADAIKKGYRGAFWDILRRVHENR
ncbi:B12-binding domain-containing radical SAM protein [Candidatus Aerophobetes bacterium Ae_b3b]|nr:MAG: B12-binding domain-containing radical SAM protein [Candidatus Aerophobetes bacterium Ae_b3b]